MKTILCILALFLLALPGVEAQAPKKNGLINEYRARLSDKDHSDGHGHRLDTPGKILRRDRVYFHLLHQPDGEDDDDHYFDSPEHRDNLVDLVDHAFLSRDTIRSIVEGTPLVEVKVFRENEDISITVTILKN